MFMRRTLARTRSRENPSPVACRHRAARGTAPQLRTINRGIDRAADARPRHVQTM